MPAGALLGRLQGGQALGRRPVERHPLLEVARRLGEKPLAARPGRGPELGLARTAQRRERLEVLGLENRRAALPGQGQQDRVVVILPQQPRELLCLAGARGQCLGPAPRQERHVAPVQLHPLAPGVEGLVARLPVRLPKRLARLAVGIAQPVDEVVELDLRGGFRR